MQIMGPNGPQEIDPSEIKLPDLRTFEVRRVNVETDAVETITIQSHSVDYGQAGYLVFTTLIVTEQGVVPRIRRAFSHWEDLVETTQIVPIFSPSLIAH